MSRSRAQRGGRRTRPFHPVIGDVWAGSCAEGAEPEGAEPARAAGVPLPEPPREVEDERRFFERELADVRPLRPGPGRVPAARSRGRGGQAAEARAGGARPEARLVVERRDGGLVGARAGVSRETLHFLARGESLAEARCDLHGLRAEAAARRLESFIEESVARGRRAVLVICGRGLHSGPAGPVLLEVSSEVLGRSSAARHVQAFAATPPGRGGEGALMVLLRRRHERGGR